MTPTIVSREYKVMLKSERFSGSQEGLLERARNFWNSFAKSIERIALGTDGRLDSANTPRIIRFYDTADHHLRSSNYIFRERIDAATGKGEVTLKFRHEDRYISGDRNMAAADGGATKFEEDIKSPFMTLYSFSTTQKISKGKSLNRVTDLVKLYPGLKKPVAHFQKDEKIETVGDFVAQEIVITNANFKIAKNPKVETECALIVWYDEAGAHDKPVVVEFSFRYGSKQGEYGGKAAQRAFGVFGTLTNSLPEWVDSEGPTKTEYAYLRAERSILRRRIW